MAIYDISGPLFFGAAERAMGALRSIRSGTKAVIFRLEEVPTIDATGLVAFESAILELNRHGIHALLVGLHGQAAQAMKKAGVAEAPGRLSICADMIAAFRVLGAPLSTAHRKARHKGPLRIHIQSRKFPPRPKA